MNTTLELKQLERKLRSTKVYQDWVQRNRTQWCFLCNTEDKLECHHIISLYHLILGIWKLYGDTNEVLAHITAMHQDDRVECVTLCDQCHGKRHPGRLAVRKPQDTRVAEWAAIPRNFWFGISHSTKDSDPNSLGLIGLQTLFGIGWHILNGKTEERMMQFNRRRFADLLGKTPGTSFNRSLDQALFDLDHLDVLIGTHMVGNDIELHLAPAYIERLKDNPWFLSLEEVRTTSMCTLMLRWFLSHQCRRKSYRISLEKLRLNLGIQTDRPSVVLKGLHRSCKDISWAEMDYAEGMCNFELRRRSAIPIYMLRNMLMDCLEH